MSQTGKVERVTVHGRAGHLEKEAEACAHALTVHGRAGHLESNQFRWL